MATEQKLKCIKIFEEAMGLYRSRQFEKALLKFKEALSVDPTDKPSQIFIERSEYFILNPPPEDWDGVYDMKTK